MNSNIIWTFLLVMQLLCVTSHPLEANTAGHDTGQELPYRVDDSNNRDTSQTNNEQVISVRITSSIAVGRGTGKTTQLTTENNEFRAEIDSHSAVSTTKSLNDKESEQRNVLEGANIEFIKQLNAKKGSNKDPNIEQIHPFQQSMYQRYNETISNKESTIDETTDYEHEQNEENTPFSDNIPSPTQDVGYYNKGIDRFESSILGEALKYSNERLTSNATDDLIGKAESNKVPEVKTSLADINRSSFDRENYNVTDDSVAEPSFKTVLEISNKNNEDYENIENVPLARSVVQSPSSKNFIQDLAQKQLNEKESSTRLTTVSFNVVHDAPNTQSNTFREPTKLYETPSQTYERHQKFYDHPQIYSQPAQIYSEPAKFYSEPAKIYSEPAKIYSEPAKIYSEPAKIYSEPAKFYSEPASLHLRPNVAPNYSPWDQRSQRPSSTTTFETTPFTTITIPNLRNTARIPEHQAEKNYEVDERVSVLTDGRSHGVQETTTEKCKQDNCKVGYVVKGRQYNKYRVEERTSDGFIVGEYGVVRNEDGALRGVRYTADSEASPRLIYDALMKFLQLK